MHCFGQIVQTVSCGMILRLRIVHEITSLFVSRQTGALHCIPSAASKSESYSVYDPKLLQLAVDVVRRICVSSAPSSFPEWVLDKSRLVFNKQ